MTNISKLPSADIWVIESLRFTVFLSDKENKPSGLSSWWEKLTGHDDRSVSIDRHSHVHVENGVFDTDTEDGKQTLFQISYAPGKVDLILLPNQDTEIQPKELNIIGDLQPNLAIMSTIVSSWAALAGCPKSTRLALGTSLLHSVSSKEEGYKILGPYLKNYVKLDLDSSDFRYHINRRRQSKSDDDLSINRLSQWFVWLWQRSNLQINLANNTVSREDLLASPQFAVRADLDINTVPDNNLEFDCSQYSGIYSELSDLATELAEKGDHK